MNETHQDQCVTTLCIKLDANGLRDLPKEPAFYQFVNQKGEYLYGGSTNNLRRRATEHVRQGDRARVMQ